MKKNIYHTGTLSLLLFLCGLLTSCHKEETPVYVPDPVEELTDEIDKWFYDNFQKPYNCVIRWKWDDNFVASSYRVTPPKRDVMIPVGNVVLDYWVEPFLQKGGEKFIKEHFPPEIICVGSPLLNPDGTETQGYAEAGVRITLTNLNNYSPRNREWLHQQLSVIHHEFTHIIHQKHGLPMGYEYISPESYTANAWINKAPEEAIALGMVTPYGSSDKYEDFCELVSHYLMYSESDFTKMFITPVSPDDGTNAGRAIIAQKLKLTLEYYKSNFGIDLSDLRDYIQTRLNALMSSLPTGSSTKVEAMSPARVSSTLSCATSCKGHSHHR